MTFSQEQINELNKELPARLISERKGGGNTTLKYVEGHDCIDTANRIFGYGCWGHEPLYVKQEVLMDPVTGEAIGVAYKAAVRLQVAGCEPITDVGSQPVASWNVSDVVLSRRKRGDDRPIEEWEKVNARRTIAESHEQAEKGAVTDALKRCLRAYGNQFGNSLYGPERTAPQLANEEQWGRVRAFCKSLNRQIPGDDLTMEDASQLLRDLATEYQARKQKAS